jgi:hypothetical protein
MISYTEAYLLNKNRKKIEVADARVHKKLFENGEPRLHLLYNLCRFLRSPKSQQDEFADKINQNALVKKFDQSLFKIKLNTTLGNGETSPMYEIPEQECPIINKHIEFGSCHENSFRWACET